MLLDTRGLFSDPAVNDDCRAVLGFTGLEAVNVMETVRMLSETELAKRFDRMLAARDASVPHIRSWHRQQKNEDQLSAGEDLAAIREIVEAIEDLTTNIAQATAIHPDVIAVTTGYERSTVEAVLSAFTLTAPADIEVVLDVSEPCEPHFKPSGTSSLASKKASI